MARGIWSRGRNWFYDLLWGEQGDEAYLDENSLLFGEAPSGGAAPRSGGGKRDPAMSIIKKIGLALAGSSGSIGRDYEEPEFDFTEITNAYNTEGYVRQAVDKYVEMIFKADYDFVGKNPAAVEYVNLRLALMAEATQIPTRQLFLEIGEDLVKYHNVVIAKARAKDALPFQGMNVMGVGENMPVAGYFPLNLASMKIKRDKFGTIKGWQQEVEGQDKPVNFKPQDIVHIYYKREKGRGFATPFLLPALDDIRALRQIEENILRLVYRNLHPLWHIKVGTEQPGGGAEPEEVERVRLEVENMDVEGGLVTSERVNIAPVASNQIIDAKEYLKHFEQRAFTVLGVSELMMGRGNTANRSTGDNLSGEFTDRCKAYQRIMETFVNDLMIKEILMEGGFDPVLNPDDQVFFRFKEIDTDSQIKAENQAVFLYEHNAISEDEMRQRIGYDIIEDGGEVRAKMHLNVITIPTLEVQAALKPATTAGGSGSTSNPKSTKSTDNKTKPSNQHGTKSSPKKTTNAKLVALLSDGHREYEKLNSDVHVFLSRYFSEKDEEYLKDINQLFVEADQALIDVIESHLGEDISMQMKLPIRRMVETLRVKVITTAGDMTGKEAYEHTKDVTQATFEVISERLGSILTKAFEMSEEGVENNE